MSDTATFVRCALATIAILTALMPRSSAAQDLVQLRRTADSIAELSARATDEYRRLVTASQAEGRTPGEGSATRLVTAGALNVIAGTALLRDATQAAEQTWRALLAVYGERADDIRHERWVIGLRNESSGERAVRSGVRDGNGAIVYVELDERSSSHLVQAASALWYGQAAELLYRRMQPNIRAWLGEPLPAATYKQPLLESVFRSFAVGHARALRACLNGSLDICKNALGIQSDTGTSVLTDKSRASLVLLALQAGGANAYARLDTTATLNVAARLELAAGIPMDSLVQRWQASVVASRPAPASTRPITAAAALLWGALLCFISTRSTRWR